jgi:hypothetical protein
LPLDIKDSLRDAEAFAFGFWAFGFWMKGGFLMWEALERKRIVEGKRIAKGGK